MVEVGGGDLEGAAMAPAGVSSMTALKSRDDIRTGTEPRARGESSSACLLGPES